MTQMEFTDSFFFDLPDELVNDNDFSSQPSQANSVNSNTNNGLIDSSLINSNNNQQQQNVGPQSQIKQQIQFKIINGAQQHHNSQPYSQQVTNSPVRGKLAYFTSDK